MRDSVVTAELLGPHKHDGMLVVGDTQRMQFEETSLPPWYDPDAPKWDREPKLRGRGHHAQYVILAGRTKEEYAGKGKLGYVGKPKGLKQILWETGWWVDGMIGDVKPEPAVGVEKRDWVDKQNRKKADGAREVMRQRLDFKNEMSELEELIVSYGHILVMSPKCHPELAGHGIEYCWGLSKLYFRRHNTLVPAKFHDLVMASFAQIDRKKVMQFERQARLYREVQKDETINNYNALELKVKAERKRKVHQSAVDMDGGWISKFLGDND